MKFSFPIPSKSAPKSTIKPKASAELDASGENNCGSKRFVTEFDPSKPLASSNRTIIIPPKENEWRPHKRMKNIDLLPTLKSDGEDLRFEVAFEADDVDDKSMSYGLNLRGQNNASGETGGTGLKCQQKHESTENFLLKKLKYDLQRLPDDQGFDEFNDVPVEAFGVALLAGYGWHEGKGIGKNAKEDVKVKEYAKRTNKEGLGFAASASNTNSKYVKDTNRQKEKEKRTRNML